MKLSDIEIILGLYIKDEVLPHIPNTLTRFAVATGSALAIGKGELLIKEYMPIIKALGIIDVDGNVNIDALYKASKEGLDATGGKIQIGGLIFNSDDIEKLYGMLKEQEV